jgi:hypothetical protein
MLIIATAAFQQQNCMGNLFDCYIYSHEVKVIDSDVNKFYFSFSLYAHIPDSCYM